MPNRSKQKPPPPMANHGEPTPLEMEAHLGNASDVGHASKFEDLSERVRQIQSPIADNLIITDVVVASIGKESTENPPFGQVVQARYALVPFAQRCTWILPYPQESALNHVHKLLDVHHSGGKNYAPQQTGSLVHSDHREQFLAQRSP